ncbi:MAG TPA: hypothetical protein VFF73_05320 [Planctomycetota bacterium]|nr:hypothetical protein [Planctomycetota bacterium]
MSDATSNAAGDAAQPADPECGKDALNRLVERTRHTISGARFTIEKCPDATASRAVKGAAVLGSVLTGGSFLLRRSRFFMIAAGVGGALLGALGSRYHVSFDWDPDRAFGGDRPRGEVR